jgi:hypothetical protein
MLGDLLAMQGRMPQALTAYAMASWHCPENPGPLINAANVMLLMHQAAPGASSHRALLAEALRAYSTALRLHPWLQSARCGVAAARHLERASPDSIFHGDPCADLEELDVRKPAVASGASALMAALPRQAASAQEHLPWKQLWMLAIKEQTPNVTRGACLDAASPSAASDLFRNLDLARSTMAVRCGLRDVQQRLEENQEGQAVFSAAGIDMLGGKR